MRLLYPGTPFQWKQVDPTFKEEEGAAKSAGLAVSTFSFEDFESGILKLAPQIVEGEVILYRGWMLTPDRYYKLGNLIRALGADLLVTTEQYRGCHHLPGWYDLLKDHTAETVVVPGGEDLSAALAKANWPGYFVKDYVKSLSTGTGSVAKTAADVVAVAKAIEMTRGTIEGGYCLRRLEAYVPGSEERYFVAFGKVFDREEAVPALVEECSRRIKSPFFSVDVARTTDGTLRVIELGDGQVSDLKRWSADQFAKVLTELGDKLGKNPR